MSDRNSVPPGPQATTITTCGDLALSKPAGWLDKSMVILSAPPVDGKFPPSVVINRAPLPKEQSTSDYAELCAADGAEEFAGFELLDRDPASVGGGTAPAFRFPLGQPARPRDASPGLPARIRGHGAVRHALLAPPFRGVRGAPVRTSAREHPGGCRMNDAQYELELDDPQERHSVHMFYGREALNVRTATRSRSRRATLPLTSRDFSARARA